VLTPFQLTNESGVGLGLSVANCFVEAMNGSIHAEDTPGGGRTIVISLALCGSRAVILSERVAQTG
jgi:two-component system sensor histidine kinase KdpD